MILGDKPLISEVVMSYCWADKEGSLLWETSDIDCWYCMLPVNRSEQFSQTILNRIYLDGIINRLSTGESTSLHNT
jgi:hypothetical protein